MWRRAGTWVAVIALAKFVVQFWSSGSYGFFVDELYYLACGEHLAWGYVDQPPLIAVVVHFTRALLGESLRAIRFPAVLAGVATVVLAAALARELGGRRWSQVMAALCVVVAPAFMAIDSFVSMNAFEPLFWTGCAWAVARVIRTGEQRWWLLFGVLAGVGLLNKHSMLIFGFGITVGLMLTAARKALASKWVWIGLVIAVAIFLPNLLWNVENHFPFLELQANIARSGRNVAMPAWKLLLEEAQLMNPLTLPVWIAGLWFLLRRVRVLGIAVVVMGLVIVVLNPRVYYLFPLFPILFAAGAVAWEEWLGDRFVWARPVYVGAMVLVAAVLAPLAMPVLAPETYVRYAQAIHLDQPRIENGRLGPLPQIFADQFGWEEMTAVVAKAFHALPEEEQARTAIFGQSYGQAGAIDFYGSRYGLPHAISGHQSYYLWGPRGFTGESAIVLDDNRETLEKICREVRLVGRVEHPYSMPSEHFDVFHCRGLKPTFAEMWPRLKRWR